MTEAAATVAQMRAQATRDEQGRRVIVGLLDVQGNERGQSNALLCLGRSVSLIGAVAYSGAYLYDGVPALVALFQTGHFGKALTIGVNPYLYILLPYLVNWPFLIFPQRSLYTCLDALLRCAMMENDRLAPNAVPQPKPLEVVDLPAGGEEIGPLLRWNSEAIARTRRLGAIGVIVVGVTFTLIGVALSIGILFTLLPSASNGLEVLLSYLFSVIALVVAGIGVWAIAAGWRTRRMTTWMRHDLAATANTDGLAWDDPAWPKRHHMRVAWRDMRSFSVATYQREAGGDKWQVYILDEGKKRLLWALPFYSSAEQSAVHERLAGLIVGATGLPLRDITPGVVALGVALRSANPLLQTKEEKAFAATQPNIPGAPLRAMRRWAYGYYTVLLASLGITPAYFALGIAVHFIH